MQNFFSNKTIRYFLIFLSFILLAIIFTYPLILSFSSSTSGWDVMNDSELFLWNFWWVKYALLDLKTNPFYTSYLFYPSNVSLTLHTLTFFPALVSLVFQMFTKNIIIVYNILFLLSFVFSGFGTYLLINYLYKNKLIAYIGGVAFAFCPYVFAHAYSGHFNLMNTWTLPLYFYFLFRIFDKKRLIDVILVALIVIFQVYTDFHYLFFMLIASFIITLWYFLKYKQNITVYLKNISVLILTTLIFSLPIIIPTYKFSKIYNDYQAQRTNYLSAVNSTNIRHYFPGPNYQSKIFSSQEKIDFIEKNFAGGIRENNIFFGYILMFLALMALIYAKNNKKWLFFIIGLIFLVISFGFHLGFGEHEFTTFKLPAYYLSTYFFKNSDLVYSRFSIVTMLMIVILACGFLSYLVKNKPKFSKIILPIVLIAVTLEFINIPVTLTKYEKPTILEKIGKENSNFRYISLPNELYWQTILEKPQLVGVLGRRANDYYFEEGKYSNIDGIRLYYAIGNLSVGANDEDKNQKIVSDQFKEYNIKYIILNKSLIPEAQIEAYRNISEKILNLDVYYEDDIIVVYKTL